MIQPLRLLAATDLSPPSRDAALRAALIARETGASLDLLHVAELGALERLRGLLGGDAPADLEAAAEAEARARARAFGDDLAGRAGSAPGVQVRVGAALPAIAAHADGMQADVLVLGARGEGFLRRAALGTTAERLLASSPRPLLVVRQPAHASYRRVLVPIDFSACSLRALRLARRVAPAAELVLVHAFGAPFEARLRFAEVHAELVERYNAAARREAEAKFAALLASEGLDPARTRTLVLHGDPAASVLEREQAEDCDLVAIGKHGEGGMQAWLLGGVAKHVLANARGDVLLAT